VATEYQIDYENGNNGNDGSNWANAWRDWNGIVGVVPGDVVRIAKTPDPVNIGDVDWAKDSDTLTLHSVLTKNIDDCELSWLPGVNASQADNTTRYTEGSVCQRFYMSDGLTGIFGFDTFSSKNLSSFTKISFSISTNRILDANTISVKLYSDSNRANLVHTFLLDFKLPSDFVSQVTIDNGSALNNNIEAIEIVAESPLPGATYIYVDNFIACNDLSLTSVIKKTGDNAWWPIRSINSKTIVLGKLNSYSTFNLVDYTGSTETADTYIRNAVMIPDLVQNTDDNFMTVDFDGTSGNLITISGGWNTSSDVQDGESWVDMFGKYGDSKVQGDYNKLEKCGFLRGYHFVISGNNCELGDINSSKQFYGLNLTGNNCTCSGDICIVASQVYGVSSNSKGHIGIGSIFLYRSNTTGLGSESSWGNIYCYGSSIQLKSHNYVNYMYIENSSGNGLYLYQINSIIINNLISFSNTNKGLYIQSCTNITIRQLNCYDNGSDGIQVQHAQRCYFKNVISHNNTGYGLHGYESNLIYANSIVTYGNSLGGIRSDESEIYLEWNTHAEVIKYSIFTRSDSMYTNQGIFFSHKDQIKDVHEDTLPIIGTITSDNVIFYNEAPSWKIEIVNEGRLEILKFRIPVQDSVRRIIRVQTRWDSVSVPTLKPKIILTGCGLNEEAINTSATATWEQLVVQGVPLRDGIAYLTVAFHRAYNTSTSVYIDDITWSTPSSSSSSRSSSSVSVSSSSSSSSSTSISSSSSCSSSSSFSSSSSLSTSLSSSSSSFSYSSSSKSSSSSSSYAICPSGWSADKCVGGTPTALSERSVDYNAAKAFDDNNTTLWQSTYDNTQWLQYHFISSVAIENLRIRSWSSVADKMPSTFILYASNLGLFTGEEVTLLTVSGITWTTDEWKEWAFTNGVNYSYYRITMTDKEGPFGEDYEYVICEVEMKECT